jgi:hypothetical protein
LGFSEHIPIMAPKRPKRPKDFSLAAKLVIDIATGQAMEEPEEDTPAVAFARLGGLRGGAARAATLSPAKRKSIAKKAAQARWKKYKPPK